MLQAGWIPTRRHRHPHVCATAQQQGDDGAGLGRAALLRQVALLSACSAAAALQPWQQPAPAAAAEAASSAAASPLPLLAPLRYSPAGPHSRLELADLQLLPLPPGPVAFPRRQLELNFAVLQLRSGYEAVDDLDCIPMVSMSRDGRVLLCHQEGKWPGCRAQALEAPHVQGTHPRLRQVPR